MTSPLTDAVRAQIRAERQERRISQAALARNSGMAPSTLLRIENGREKGRHVPAPDMDQIERLCDALGLPVGEFFRRVQTRLDRDAAQVDVLRSK